MGHSCKGTTSLPLGADTSIPAVPMPLTAGGAGPTRPPQRTLASPWHVPCGLGLPVALASAWEKPTLAPAGKCRPRQVFAVLP